MFTAKKEKKQEALLTQAHHEYCKGLKVHAFFKVHNPEICKDLVQETFMKTWRYLVRGGKIEHMRAFLYRVLNDLIIDEYRKRKAASLDELLEKGFEISMDETDKKINVIDGKSAIRLLKFLPKKDREIIKMRYIQELSIEEIADIKKVSKNNTAVQIHRGMNKLRALYRERAC